MPKKDRKKIIKIKRFTDIDGKKKGSIKEFRNPFTGAYRTVEKDRRSITADGKLSKTKQVGTSRKGLKKIKSKRPGMGYAKSKDFRDGGQTPQSVGTFKQAFRQAKNSGVKTFMWKGKRYTTETAKPKMSATRKKVNKTVPGPKRPGEMKKGGYMKRFSNGGFMQYD